MANRLDPLIPGGPAPTETIADWHAVRRVAREWGHPDAAALDGLDFDESSVGQTENSRMLTLWFFDRPSMSRATQSLIFSCAAHLFGPILLGVHSR